MGFSTSTPSGTSTTAAHPARAVLSAAQHPVPICRLFACRSVATPTLWSGPDRSATPLSSSPIPDSYASPSVNPSGSRSNRSPCGTSPSPCAEKHTPLGRLSAGQYRPSTYTSRASCVPALSASTPAARSADSVRAVPSPSSASTAPSGQPPAYAGPFTHSPRFHVRHASPRCRGTGRPNRPSSAPHATSFWLVLICSRSASLDHDGYPASGAVVVRRARASAANEPSAPAGAPSISRPKKLFAAASDPRRGLPGSLNGG
mmetsp:Transcript_7285/g.15132  ORF Transcript_7285/g.15132 Transcript_7285/m.15132 type:complete len:260 (+) Transcript_7285:1278-2057(+)